MFLFSCLLCVLFDEWTQALFAIGGFALLVLLMTVIQLRGKGSERIVAPYRIPCVTVVRDGRLYTVSARNIVCGDVILLSKGDIVPTDCRLVEQSEHFMALSACFGEGGRPVMRPMEKNAHLTYPYGQEISLQNAQNILLGGMEILDGECRAIVIATGEKCLFYTNEATLLPTEKTRTEQNPFRALSPYLRLYGLILYSLFIILFAVSLFTCAGRMTVMQIFLTVSAFLMLSSQTVWELCLRIQIGDTVQKGFDGGSIDRVVFKSDTSLSALSSVTDLFVFGSCAVTDGKRHLYRVLCGNGEIDLQQSETHLIGLSEALCLYRLAEQEDDGGRTRVDLYEDARGELLSCCNYDIEALRMRMRGTTTFLVCEEHRQTVFVEQGKHSYQLLLTHHMNDALKCTRFEFGTASYPIDTAHRELLISKAKEYQALGCYPLYILRRSQGVLSLVGVLALREEIQDDLAQTVEALKKRNIRVTFFFDGTERATLSDFRATDPSISISAAEISAEDPAVLCKLYEKYRVFRSFSTQQIGKIIKELRKRGHRIAYLGNRTDELTLMQMSDAGIVCDTVAYHNAPVKSSLFERLMHAGDTDDAYTSQTMRRRADAVICRAQRQTGGLHAVLRALDLCRQGQQKQLSILRFLLGAQIAPVVTVILSSLLGKGTLNAAQLLFVGWLIELSGVLLLLSIPLPKRMGYKPILASDALPGKLLRSRAVWLPPLCASLVSVLFGAILCHTQMLSDAACSSYVFLSIIFVQLLLYFSVLRSLSAPRRGQILLLLVLLFLIVFSIFCLLFPRFAQIFCMGDWNLICMLGLMLPILSYTLSHFLFCKKKNGQPRK